MSPIPISPPGGNAQELERLLQAGLFSTVFQPIIDLSAGQIFGFESAVRGPADSPLHSPLVLFETAEQAYRLVELDMAACRAACQSFAEQNLPACLFLNITAPSLLDRSFRSALSDLVRRQLQMNPQRIVLELTEQHPMNDFEQARRAAAEIRQLGFGIALDDLGAGYAGLRLWSELKPQFVKIDRHFIQNLHEDPVKLDFVRSISSMAKDMACRVIAEGIETAEELNAIIHMGIGLGQGYLLGKPRAIPAATVPVALTQPLKRLRASGKMTAGELARPCHTVQSEVSTEAILDRFLSDRLLNAIPVVDLGIPVGLVLRHEIADLFSARYQRELHGRKPIRQFMRTRPLCVESHIQIEDVSRMMTDDSEEELVQYFIVTRGGQYLGIGGTRALLRRITELQISNAQHCNPLTQLPGNVPIYEHVEALLESGQDFRVAYCDLNHFKPYNDLYGYARGDTVLQMTAGVLRRHLGSDDFIGHIGGDDFVLVLRSKDWQTRCEGMLDEFAQHIRLYYPAPVLEQGGVYCEDRRGKRELHPLVSLAIGVVHPDPALCSNQNDVALLATEAKHEAKKHPGNFLFICRRRFGQTAENQQKKTSIVFAPKVMVTAVS